MARYLYGGTAADVTTTRAGQLVTGATLTVWDSQTGGTQITDLQDATGAAATVVTSDAYGRVLFYGPDGENRALWLQGSGPRMLVRPAASIMPANDSVETVHLKDGAVTSAKIANDTIVNADISASAAIAASKISGTAVVQARQVATDGTSLTGGGDLSADRTLSVKSGGITSTHIADGTIVNGDINASAAIALSKLAADAWTSYTPTVTSASAPQPSGWTQTGYYMQIGKLVIARFKVVAPSANFGTGVYRIALPVTAASSYPADGTPIGQVYFEDAGSAGYFGLARIAASATYMTVSYLGASSTIANSMGSTTPFTWGQNDFAVGQITYEAA